MAGPTPEASFVYSSGPLWPISEHLAIGQEVIEGFHVFTRGMPSISEVRSVIKLQRLGQKNYVELEESFRREFGTKDASHFLTTDGLRKYNDSLVLYYKIAALGALHLDNFHSMISTQNALESLVTLGHVHLSADMKMSERPLINLVNVVSVIEKYTEDYARHSLHTA
jgi:hypothetical protein